MGKLSKRIKAIREKTDPLKLYNLDEAVGLIKSLSSVKFDETVEIAVNLGVDSRKSDQAVRGATVLPHGTGRKLRVAVFAQGSQAEAAKAAGADVVGFEDLAESVKAGKLDFDVVIASVESMRIVGQLGQVLGPKGLMPNPKVGTVTNDVALAVKNAKAGQVQYRTDKNGIIHAVIGKISFDEKAIKENFQALISDLKKSRPTNAKGVFLKRITLSSTMGPGLNIDTTSVG